MKFILWLDPDLEEDDPKELLAFVLASIENNPDLAWDITSDDGRLIGEGVRRERP